MEEKGQATAHDAAWPTACMLWPFAAAQVALDNWLWWFDRTEHRFATELSWTTPNEVALELTTMRLRSFARESPATPVLVCAPYALHGALLADFAPGHSIIGTLQRGGLDRTYLTDWRSASTEMRYLSIDSYLGDLNVAIDEIGAPVDLVGLCQGGWLSLIYAARFPEKVRRLVLVGTPVDMSVESSLTRLVHNAPPGSFEQIVARGGGNVSGQELLQFWSRPLRLVDAGLALQRSLDTDCGGQVLERWLQWHQQTRDLPGLYLPSGGQLESFGRTASLPANSLPWGARFSCNR